MKEVISYIVVMLAIVVILFLLVGKGIPLLEDLRVVEVAPEIECAIVSRIAHTSIDCWKKEVSKRRQEILDSLGQGADLLINYNEEVIGTSVLITPTYTQKPMTEGLPINHTVNIDPKEEVGLVIGGGHDMSKGHLYIERRDIPDPPAYKESGTASSGSLEFKIPPSLSVMKHNATSIKCGEGTIDVDYDTGEATFVDGCDPSEASKELWRAIKPFFDLETR